MNTDLQQIHYLDELLPNERTALDALPDNMQAKYLRVRKLLINSNVAVLHLNLERKETYDIGLLMGLDEHSALLAANIRQLIEDVETPGNVPFRQLYMLAKIYEA